MWSAQSCCDTADRGIPEGQPDMLPIGPSQPTQTPSQPSHASRQASAGGGFSPLRAAAQSLWQSSAANGVSDAASAMQGDATRWLFLGQRLARHLWEDDLYSAGAAAGPSVSIPATSASPRNSIQAAPSGRNVAETKKLRGVFYHDPLGRKGDEIKETKSAKEEQVRTGDFRQCLDVLLASDEGCRQIARNLHARFGGELSRLPLLLQVIEERWGFPSRVFPLLRTHIRRITGRPDDRGLISESMWCDAFVRWLQVLHERSSQTKVSRQVFVQTRNNQEWTKKYFMGAKLGEGTYGQVHLALHTGLGMPRVIKSVPKAQLGVASEQVEDEVEALKSMDHPHIVRIFEAFETDETLHIVMDYAEGGDVAHAIREMQGKGLPEAWARAAAGQIAAALSYMHSKGVIHCDLKPQNTMLLNQFVAADVQDGRAHPHLLLVDFGLAEIFEENPTSSKAKSVKGTPYYLAPEGFEGRLSHKSDTWSFGVMIFEMLTGQKPYRGSANVFLLFCQIMKEPAPLHELVGEPQDLVSKLLAKDPVDRLSAEQSLQHSWFGAWFDEVEAKAEQCMRDRNRSKTLAVDPSGKIQKHSAGATPAGSKETVASVTATIPEALGYSSYFYRAVMFCVASALGMKDVMPFYIAFQAIDKDRTGYLTKQQLAAGLAKCEIQQDPTATLACLDLDQDDRVSLTEFVAGALRSEVEVSEPLLHYAFATFDMDGDGYISRFDLQEVLAGDSSSPDMLPDGLTIDEVMAEVSQGEGRISFDQFSKYMRSAASRPKAQRRTKSPRNPARGSGVHRDKESDPATVAEESLCEEGLNLQLTATKATFAAEMVKGLSIDQADVDDDIGNLDSESPEEQENEFPLFHDWLADLYSDTQRGAALGPLLSFKDSSLEGCYVALYLANSCRRIALLATGMFVYCSWYLTTENPAGSGATWDPSVSRWDNSVRVLNNITWLLLAVASLSILVSSIRILMKKPNSRSNEDDLEKQDKASRGRQYQRRALRFEHSLAIFGSILPWIACFFANRARVAAVFHHEALDVFDSVSSDYDLILCMLGMLMYLTTLTHVRLACVAPVAASCSVAFIFSSALTDLTGYLRYDSCSEGWGWPAGLLALVSVANLWGHRNVEKHRRLTFLSLHASYSVLLEAHESSKGGDGHVVGSAWTSGSANMAVGENETRYMRFTKLAQVLEKLSDSMEAHKPLRAALGSLLELLNGLRSDVAQADRFRSVDDLQEALQTREIAGEARSLLLTLYDAWPLSNELPFKEQPQKLDVRRLKSSKSNVNEVLPVSEEPGAPKEPWGWDVLASKPTEAWPLAAAGKELLETAVVDAVSQTSWEPNSKGCEKARATVGVFLEGIAHAYANGPHTAEARAALTLRATHWLAHRSGLWGQLEPWERVALLIVAVGLHVGVGTIPRSQGGALLSRQPLLVHAAGMELTLDILDVSDLSSVATSHEEPVPLRRLVAQLFVHIRPQNSLRDAYLAKVQLDSDDAFPSTHIDRALLSSLTIAAADVSFLALGSPLQDAWVQLCREEAAELAPTDGLAFSRHGGEAEEVNVGSWLRGMTEIVAVPLFETLGKLPGASHHFSTPLKHLRASATRWSTEHIVVAYALNKTRTRSKPSSSSVPAPATNMAYRSSSSSIQEAEKPRLALRDVGPSDSKGSLCSASPSPSGEKNSNNNTNNNNNNNNHNHNHNNNNNHNHNSNEQAGGITQLEDRGLGTLPPIPGRNSSQAPSLAGIFKEAEEEELSGEDHLTEEERFKKALPGFVGTGTAALANALMGAGANSTASLPVTKFNSTQSQAPKKAAKIVDEPKYRVGEEDSFNRSLAVLGLDVGVSLPSSVSLEESSEIVHLSTMELPALPGDSRGLMVQAAPSDVVSRSLGPGAMVQALLEEARNFVSGGRGPDKYQASGDGSSSQEGAIPLGEACSMAAGARGPPPGREASSSSSANSPQQEQKTQRKGPPRISFGGSMHLQQAPASALASASAAASAAAAALRQQLPSQSMHQPMQRLAAPSQSNLLPKRKKDPTEAAGVQGPPPLPALSGAPQVGGSVPAAAPSSTAQRGTAQSNAPAAWASSADGGSSGQDECKTAPSEAASSSKGTAVTVTAGEAVKQEGSLQSLLESVLHD